jgi:hypothetical protein
MACDHPDFVVHGQVYRLTDVEGGPVTGYNLDVGVVCRACGCPFLFKGVPCGFAFSHPTMRFSRDEISLPIEPGEPTS